MEELFENAIKVIRARIAATTKPDETTKATQALLNITQARGLYQGLKKPSPDDELKYLLGRLRSNVLPLELQHATQSVLNLMHALVQSESGTTKKTQTT